MTRADECGASVPKENAVVSRPYRMAVAKLACYRCGVSGLTQACHGDMNKGAGLRTDDRTCWPGCGPDYMGSNGCHHFVGRIMSKDERRAFEKEAAEATIAALILKSQGVGKEAQKLRETLRSVGLVL